MHQAVNCADPIPPIPLNSETPRKKPMIILVDDEWNALLGVRRTFKHNFNLKAINCPMLALDFLADTTDVAVIVSDLRMPKMDGLTFLRKARELHPSTSLVLFTGNAIEPSAINANEDVGILRFLSKPCTPKQFSETIVLGIEKYQERKKFLTYYANLLGLKAPALPARDEKVQSFSRPNIIPLGKCSARQLFEECQHVIDRTSRNYEFTSKHISINNADYYFGNHDRLKTAVISLVLNAVKNSKFGDAISLTVKADQDDLSISVTSKDSRPTSIFVKNFLKPSVQNDQLAPVNEPDILKRDKGPVLVPDNPWDQNDLEKQLSVAHEITRQHRGEIFVSKKRGTDKGQTVTIRIPIQH